MSWISRATEPRGRYGVSTAISAIGIIIIELKEKIYIFKENGYHCIY